MEGLILISIILLIVSFSVYELLKENDKYNFKLDDEQKKQLEEFKRKKERESAYGKNRYF